MTARPALPPVRAVGMLESAATDYNTIMNTGSWQQEVITGNNEADRVSSLACNEVPAGPRNFLPNTNFRYIINPGRTGPPWVAGAGGLHVSPPWVGYNGTFNIANVFKTNSGGNGGSPGTGMTMQCAQDTSAASYLIATVESPQELSGRYVTFSCWTYGMTNGYIQVADGYSGTQFTQASWEVEPYQYNALTHRVFTTHIDSRSTSLTLYIVNLGPSTTWYATNIALHVGQQATNPIGIPDSMEIYRQNRRYIGLKFSGRYVAPVAGAVEYLWLPYPKMVGQPAAATWTLNSPGTSVNINPAGIAIAEYSDTEVCVQMYAAAAGDCAVYNQVVYVDSGV